MTEKLNLLETPPVNDSMTSTASIKTNQHLNHTATAESHPINKKMISKDKKTSCKTNTPTTSSSSILEADLTSKEKTFYPFWNKQVAELSEKLWLPTEIDSVDLDLNLLNGFSTKMMSNSWFSTMTKVPLNQSLSQTYYPSLPYSPVGFTDSESTLTRSRKIRFYPTKIQKRILFRWFGVSRYSFNKTVEYLRQPNTKASWKDIKTGLIHGLPEWSKEVPYQIKSIAIQDACKATSKAKKDTKITGKFHKIHFRSRKKHDFTLYIPKDAIRENGFYTTLLGSLNLREKVGEAEHDCRVKLENGRWFLFKPETRVIKQPDNQRIPVVALDPGVRTFQTTYSPELSIKVGNKDFARIFRLCYVLDKLYSRRKKEKTNRFGKKLEQIRCKIKDLISEIHHKLALFLVKTYEVILLPVFETSKMVKKLRSKVAREMLTWSHYRFKIFLMNKAEEYSCEVIEVNEAYTSQTCTRCGTLNDIGSKEVLRCVCGLKIDRDRSGARNIFLKNIFGVDRFIHLFREIKR